MGMLSASLPKTISVEVTVGQAGRADVQASRRLLHRLQQAGYRHFKLCRQALFNPPYWGGDMASSGPFGEAATDWRLGLAWRAAEDIAEDFQIIANMRAAGGLMAEWFDLHAALRR